MRSARPGFPPPSRVGPERRWPGGAASRCRAEPATYPAPQHRRKPCRDVTAGSGGDQQRDEELDRQHQARGGQLFQGLHQDRVAHRRRAGEDHTDRCRECAGRLVRFLPGSGAGAGSSRVRTVARRSAAWRAAWSRSAGSGLPTSAAVMSWVGFTVDTPSLPAGRRWVASHPR